MNSSTFPQNIRQEQCNPGIMPNIIKEVFMPPKAPPEVATLIESSLVYQHSANYEMAIKTLEEVKDLMKDEATFRFVDSNGGVKIRDRPSYCFLDIHIETRERA